jgi:hypothetical protein
MRRRMQLEFHVLDTGFQFYVLEMWAGHELVW